MAIKYLGMDVHQASTVAVVSNERGRCLAQTILETKSNVVVDWIESLRGTLHLTFEEGTYAAWLYELLSPHVEKIVVCDPRENKLLPSGHKSDKVDASKLAEWLRHGQLRAVYHGNGSLRVLKELARSYRCLVEDITRVMNRIKALFRSRGIDCAGSKVYQPCYRELYLSQLKEPEVQRRAARLYQQLELLKPLRQQARQDLLREAGASLLGRFSTRFPVWVRCEWPYC